MMNQAFVTGILAIASLIVSGENLVSDHNNSEGTMMINESITKSIVEAERQALERWRQGDPDGFLDMIADDYTYFDPTLNKRVDDYEGIREIYESVRGLIYFDGFDIIDPEIQVNGEIAVLTFNFRSYRSHGDSATQDSSGWHTTEVFRQIGDDWRLISTHWSFTQQQLRRSARTGSLPGEPTSVKEVVRSPTEGAVAEEVLGMERAALDRWGNGDPSGFIDIAADDITYFDPSLDKRVTGLAAFREHLEPIRGKIHIDHYKIIEPRVQTDGRTAVLTYNFESCEIDTAGEEQCGMNWHSTEIYRESGGAWELISSHWSFAQSTLMRLAGEGAFDSAGQ
jgi:ketosteroid isomerase-like protein